MASSTIKAWLPGQDSVAMMGGLPDGMTADVWTGGEQLPDSADEVEVVVLPFGVPSSRMPVLAKLPRLRHSTSPTPSRSRTPIRSGPRPACCSRRTWPA